MTRWPVTTALAAGGGGSGADLFSRILIPCAVLVTLIVIAWVAAAWIRKRTAESDADEALGMPFTLDSLRRMHAEGQLTDEEFKRAKARVLQRATGKAAAPGASGSLAGMQRSTDSTDENDDEVELGPNLLDGLADNDDSPGKT
jgi:uncharacterized membrane protein